MRKKGAETRDRTGDLHIFSLTLSQLSYRGDKRGTTPCKLQIVSQGMRPTVKKAKSIY